MHKGEKQHDILPGDQIYWTKINQVIDNLASAYGFERLELPVAERNDLFVKKLKDYVSEEEACIIGEKGSKIRLRPDFTPSIIRAYLENDLVHPTRLHAVGPLFCSNKEKKQWLDQFYHANFEIIGEKDSVIDAQLVQLFFSIGKDLGLKNLITKINSIGCSSCRPGYQKLLTDFYQNKEDILCEQCKSSLTSNPFKLLSCPECAELVAEAPQIFDCLCNECHNHLKNILEFLDEVEIPYVLNPYLFKASDYYTKTVFEISPEEKNCVLATGNRHDNLISAFGGESTPAVGIDIRLDSIVDLMKEDKIKINQRLRPLVFLVQLGCLGKKKSLNLFEKLRRAGLRVASSVSCNTITSQLEAASQLNAQFILILGQKEALDETIIIRDIYSGIQESIPLEKIIKEIKKRIKLNK